jgi:hypothetical protein
MTIIKENAREGTVFFTAKENSVLKPKTVHCYSWLVFGRRKFRLFKYHVFRKTPDEKWR